MNEEDDALVFLPLGGVGEIGMNLALYGCTGKWLMVDCGVTFGDDTTPGVDLFTPDPTFIAERRDDLLAIVLTHAHEDHIGAVPHLWRRLRCPIYGTAFTLGMLRAKLDEHGLRGEVPLREVAVGQRFPIGPFECEFIGVTHSIPEPNSLALRTRFGTLIHTGDWKFDPEPLTGPVADEGRLAEIGEEGVLALMGDSTNVFVEGDAGSEADVRATLTELFGQWNRRIAVACFASNLARVESIAVAAMRHRRQVALFGRSLKRVDKIARACGMLKGIPEFLDEDEAMSLPPGKLVAVCTGSQGEPRAALLRIATGAHPRLRLGQGDVTIFSSRVIPGNERAIFEVQNQLTRNGVAVITDHDHPVHVSGHPARDEIARYYALAKPRLVIPVHGELRHLHEHARYAASLGVPATLVVGNGDLVKLAPGPAEVFEQVPVGRLALDGARLIPFENDALRARRRLSREGGAVATIVLDRDNDLVGEPRITVLGLALEEGDEADLTAAVRAAVENLSDRNRDDDEQISQTVRTALRRQLERSYGKRPTAEVHVVRV